VRLELRASEDLESKAFWEERAGGALPVFPIHARPGESECRIPRRLSSEIPVDIVRKLGGLSKRTGLPLKSLLLAVHLRVLALVAGRTEVITALLTNGRPERLDGDKVIGMFLNPAPLRVDVGCRSWLELARAAWHAEQDLLPHRRYPYAGMEAHMHRVLDSAFNYIHLHTLERLARLRSVHLQEWRSPTDQTFFPMTAYFHLEGGSGRLFFHLDTFGDTVSRELGERIAEYYRRGWTAFAESSEAKPGNEDLLAAWETQRQLWDWNRTKRDWAPERDQPVPLLFASVAARAPDAKCVTHQTMSLCYEQVAALAGQLASTLHLRGIGPGYVVGVLVEPGLGWAVAVLGILTAGAAFLPLDPASPRGRLQWMLDDAHVEILVADEFLAAGRAFAGVEILPISLRCENQPARPSRNEVKRDEIDAEALAYVIYTSGSTGTPKGVEVTHSSLTNVLLAFQEATGCGAGDTLLSVSPSTFDISILELLLPMVCGGHLVIADRSLRNDPVLLSEEMARARPTLMQATPSTWRLLVEAGWNGNLGLSILCGGDVLSRPLADALLQRCARLWNVYGPTEATIWCTFEQVTASPDAPAVGRPLANVQAYILGPHLEPLPIGTIGSLYIGGRAVARGYRNGDGSASPRFVPDPFGPAGGRLHGTGDQARFTSDGRIELVGRSDDQVKRAGMRVHLSEVERALERLSGVEAAAVLIRGVAPGSLEACLVLRGDEDLAGSDFREQLAELLPSWMIPSRFHCIGALPLTAHGKLDRAELERVARSALAEPEDRRGEVEPANERERTIARMVGAVLEVERISLAARFDALGADSLKMLRILQALEAGGLTGLTLPQLMSCATVADLAARLEHSASPQPARERGLRRRAALEAMRRPQAGARS
jgi:amino acid adenylation domain-containing protein